MDRFLSSCDSYETNSLDWTDSEVRLEGFVGDSQVPLSFPVCADSQGTGVKCATPDGQPSVNSLESFETADSLDVEQWDLADGDVKSQCPGRRLGHAHTVVCPPPSLDTQEFELKCISSEDLPCLKSPEFVEKSSPNEMERWDLAEGDAISQGAVGALDEAETPPCPPVTLDTQEFLRGCVEQDRIISTKSEFNAGCPLPDALGLRDSDDDEGRPDLEVKLSRQEDLSSVGYLQISGLAPGEVKSQRPVRRFYCDTETQARVECSLTSQEVASRWEARKKVRAKNAVTSLDFGLDKSSKRSSFLYFRRSESPGTVANSQISEDIRDTGVLTKDVLVESAAHCELSSWDVRPATPFPRAQNLVLKISLSAAGEDEVNASKPASSVDAPLITVMPGNDGFVNNHRSKRKNKDIFLANDNQPLATVRQLSHNMDPSILKNNAPPCRSPLRPLPVNPMFISDEQDKEVRNEEECHKLMLSTTETQDLENRDPGAVPESFPTGKENVGFQRSSKERFATSSSASTISITMKPTFDAGAKHGSSVDPQDPFQSSKQIHDHLSKDTLDKRSRCFLQTKLSSHVEFTSYPARTKKLVSEDHEQTQGWLCPKASKRLLSKKPRQHFLDAWLE